MCVCVYIFKKPTDRRDYPCIQISHDVCLYFCITRLKHKNAIMLYWSNVCVVAVLPITTPLTSIAWLAMTHGIGRWVRAQILQKIFTMYQMSLWIFMEMPIRATLKYHHKPTIKDLLAWIKCLSSHFGQDQMSYKTNDHSC